MPGKTRVLLADDESIIRMGLQVILRDLGYEIAGTARDGIEAVDLARERKPDLAILDIKMPRMDGLEAAEKIHQECPMPVIILSAYNDREYVERAKSTAVHAYLVKPIREEKLEPTIEVAKARFQEHQGLMAEATNIKDSLETRDMVDKARRILMQQHEIGEADAYNRLQHQARNSRRPMRSIAQDIVDQYEKAQSRYTGGSIKVRNRNG